MMLQMKAEGLIIMVRRDDEEKLGIYSRAQTRVTLTRRELALPASHVDLLVVLGIDPGGVFLLYNFLPYCTTVQWYKNFIQTSA